MGLVTELPAGVLCFRARDAAGNLTLKTATVTAPK